MKKYILQKLFKTSSFGKLKLKTDNYKLNNNV